MKRQYGWTGLVILVLGLGWFGWNAINRATSESTDASAVVQAAVEPEPTQRTATDSPGTASQIEQFAGAMFQFGRVKLLKEASVRKAAGISSEQVGALQPVIDEAAELGSQLTSVPQAQLRERLKQDFVPAAARFEKKLAETFNETQMEKLGQTVIQRQRGAIVLLMPGVPEKLKMTDAQKRQIQALIEANFRTLDPKKLGPAQLISMLRVAKPDAGQGRGGVAGRPATGMEANVVEPVAPVPPKPRLSLVFGISVRRVGAADDEDTKSAKSTRSAAPVARGGSVLSKVTGKSGFVSPSAVKLAIMVGRQDQVGPKDGLGD